MMDFIERETAMEIVKRTSGDYAAAFSEIARLPAADVAPVIHGRWEVSERLCSSYARCSVCQDVYIDRNWITDGKWKFCPNCGVKMDGGGKA